eukprot:5287986-Pleurochrysis_carterae.AAC.1
MLKQLRRARRSARQAWLSHVRARQNARARVRVRSRLHAWQTHFHTSVRMNTDSSVAHRPPLSGQPTSPMQEARQSFLARTYSAAHARVRMQ